MKKSFQERAKLAHDVPNKLSKLMERWKQRITVSNRRLDERFIGQEIHILLRLGTADTGKEWLLCLEYYPRPHKKLVAANRQNEAVLVGVVQLVKKPKRIVPILVRLESVDSLDRFGPHTIYFSSLAGFVTLKGWKNRKPNVIPFELCGVPTTTNLHEMESQVVEGTPRVVYCVPRNGWNRFIIEDKRLSCEKSLSGLRVKIHSNNIEVDFIGRQSDDVFQFVEVLVGPFNFYADQSESAIIANLNTSKARKHSLSSRFLPFNPHESVLLARFPLR